MPKHTPYYYVRGTYLGVHLDRSTKTGSRSKAAKFLVKWKEEIERGSLARSSEVTFFDAAVNYMAVNDDRFLEPILERIGRTPLRSVTQEQIDELAIVLYPQATPATRNRQVYTPISAILKHAGRKEKIRRPKGWRGNARTEWLKPDQAFRLFDAAKGVDHEFGVFLRLLCYTGLRLGEALMLSTDNLDLAHNYAYVPKTKNGEPRPVFLPPHLVASLAAHPRGLDRPGKRVFRFVKGGRLYTLLRNSKSAAGADVSFVGFHTFRHTWAAWMRRYAGLDTSGLIATGAWKDASSVRRYEHATASEESEKAVQLPVENSWKKVG
jgi:integrase